jgi:hypothetical protein
MQHSYYVVDQLPAATQDTSLVAAHQQCLSMHTSLKAQAITAVKSAACCVVRAKWTAQASGFTQQQAAHGKNTGLSTCCKVTATTVTAPDI